jgi:hypothetical protein
MVVRWFMRRNQPQAARMEYAGATPAATDALRSTGFDSL